MMHVAECKKKGCRYLQAHREWIMPNTYSKAQWYCHYNTKMYKHLRSIKYCPKVKGD